MGKSSPKPPPAPDPVKTAQAQAAANRESAIASQEMSMVDQLTPYGNLVYKQIGTSAAGNPRYQAQQVLSPQQQNILDLQTGLSQKYGQTAQNQLNNVSSVLSKPIDYSTLGAAPQISEATRTATRNAIMARVDPQLRSQRSRLETQLANQGFMTGSRAYNSAIDEFNRQRNDIMLAADAQAGNEMARMYGLESAARDRAINEMIQQRSQPLNELAAMASGTQVQGPQFVNAPGAQVAPADIMGATYGSAGIAQNNYAQQMAARNAQTQGLYSLLGAGAQAAGFAFGR